MSVPSKPSHLIPAQQTLRDPAVAPTVETSPQSLGLEGSEHPDHDNHLSESGRRRRLSSVVEKTTEKLARSLSAKSRPSSSHGGSGHRSLFSMSRKGRKSAGGDDGAVTPASSRSSISGAADRSVPSTPASAPDDSPFIRPPSPTQPARASFLHRSLTSFLGEGSMRLGTQTLIQALQSVPWAEEADGDDDPQTPSAMSEDEDASHEGMQPLASSIHTIHRPVALSRRQGAPSTQRKGAASQSGETGTITEDDGEGEDFEETTPRISHAPPPLHIDPRASVSSRRTSGQSTIRSTPSRTGSMATVRMQRRNRLASKLKEVFELEGIDEVVAEMPCWLLRSVLLQGYMYLTNSYLCFFAHMPSREDQVLKSGLLHKKSQRTKRWIKHWFVLKNDALSWFNSSSDPYFPHGIVDLRYAISCEPVGEKEFRVRTNQKVVHLQADSVPSRDEWVKAVRKVIFKAQNMGDSVKIAIPYSAILDVEKSSAMDFSETIEVKVVDKDDSYSVDSYFFAYFHDLPAALDQIRDAVRVYRSLPEPPSPYSVMDTTAGTRTPVAPQAMDRAVSAPASDTASRTLSAFRLPSLFRTVPSTPEKANFSSSDVTDNEEFTHISRRPNSFVPITASPKQMTSSELPSEAATPTQSTIEHTYPPSTSSSSTQPDSSLHSATSGGSGWTVGVPSWLKGRPRLLGGGIPRVKEMYTPPTTTPSAGSGSLMGDMAFSVLETPEATLDVETTEKFRAAFAYDEKEMLLGYFPGFLFRLLPINGRLYISTNFFCFKSSGPLATRTRMAIPIRDILATEKSKGTRFGHHGVIVIIKGHEELFFEFWGEDKRDSFMRLLGKQMEDVHRRLASGESNNVPSQGNRDALILEEFEPPSADDPDAPAPDTSMTDSLPAVMFTSASSTFLTFKPNKSMHFTCLTIGSRGDVQPYIALAKGLMADGHRVRIATHVEFKDWIESYGIEYGYVGGDPAELMRICVENGMFTVSFLKEGLQKFRGWLDDLLKTSWDACQGTDVLIESPSAMGGLHIAEALRIPYFRAFTMTWTRTRAYPHAFAVPERKMGGGYNYMSYVMFDQVFWRAIAGQVNRWRRKSLNLDSTNLDRMEPHKIPFLYNFSPTVVPPPLDWPEWIRITGYWFLDDADASGKKWSPPDSLNKFIHKARKEHKKIVYIGFGSIVVSDPKTMTRCVIEAVVNSGVRAILSKGWSDRLTVKTTEASDIEEPLPSSIYPIASIPHDWLFQRIDAACHHGGAGTTGASLRAGIPTIIHPFFGDQFFWADRVEALGVGSGVRRLTVESLTDALRAATTDAKQIEKAKAVGEKIRSEDGVATAIESIYRDLEYARSLIKAPPTQPRPLPPHDDSDEELVLENSTIRDSVTTNNSEHNSGYNSSSGGGAPSEDWSMVSADGEERRPSTSGSRPPVQRRRSSADRIVNKRNSIAAAMLAVLPDSLASPRRAASPGA